MIKCCFLALSISLLYPLHPAPVSILCDIRLLFKMLSQYTYIFVIGTFFAMLDAFNNGASAYLRTPSLDVIILTDW
jgi:hypothetical protein